MTGSMRAAWITVAGLALVGVGYTAGALDHYRPASPAHRDTPAPTEPAQVESYCDHGVRVWPGTGVFPDLGCQQ